LFANLAEPPVDPILGLAQLFAGDSSPDKVDLGIGVYHDERGEAPVLPSVKDAERWLLRMQQSKRYLSSAGNAAYNLATRTLLFDDTDAFGRSRTIQTPGGTGALRVAAEFLRRLRPGGRVFIPTPTWANHSAILNAAGHEVVSYPYYDVATGTLRFDEMIAALGGLTAKDTLLVHGCCHNPSGADPSLDQWRSIADLLAGTGAMVLVDLAYLGFAEGLAEDAASVRLLAARLPEVMVASSYSKNFALYRERVGALTVVGASASDAATAHAHLLPIARTIYSMPPDHGAAIVARILSEDHLRTRWQDEVTAMRDRIKGMRVALVDALAGRSARDYGFLARQRGMFAMLGIGPEAVGRLRGEHHVHVVNSGRVNVAGLTEQNVERVAVGIAAVS
jgi:aspartate/tyrosine/aromatic aminotransferase